MSILINMNDLNINLFKFENDKLFYRNTYATETLSFHLWEINKFVLKLSTPSWLCSKDNF